MDPDVPGGQRSPTGQADAFEKRLMVEDCRIGILEDRQKKVGQRAGVDFLYLFDGTPALTAQLFEDGRQ